MTTIKVSRVDRVIDQLRLLFILTFHPRQAAFFLQPFAHETENVNAPRVRRVVERLVLDVNAIVEHRRQVLRNAARKRIDAVTPATHVLLRAGDRWRIC